MLISDDAVGEGFPLSFHVRRAAYVRCYVIERRRVLIEYPLVEPSAPTQCSRCA
jgi:hypothetical protein